MKSILVSLIFPATFGDPFSFDNTDKLPIGPLLPVFWIQISRTKLLAEGNTVDVTDGLHMVLRPRLRGISFKKERQGLRLHQFSTVVSIA